MRKCVPWVFTFVALLFAACSQGQAACTTTPSMTVLESGAVTHFTVQDNTTCAALPSAALSVSTVGTGSPGCAATAVGMAAANPTKILVAQDPVSPGLDFTAVAGATGMAACNVLVQYTDGTQVLSYTLNVTLSSGVIAISGHSP